jgi:molybdate transport system substrate-binding protein
MKITKMHFVKQWVRAGLCLLFILPSSLQADTLYVAVAANAQHAFKEIAQVFQKNTGIHIKSTIGSSGKFVAQITHGAPFDIFLSADMNYPQKLYKLGLTSSAPKPYAQGKLVLWTTRNIPLKEWSQALQSPLVKKIGIANPDFAPYGREGLRFLKQSNLLKKVQSKLVYGDSVAQTDQYIATGNVEVGLTAQSTIFAYKARKNEWIAVPKSLYQPILQGVVILKSSSHQSSAHLLVKFLFSPTARAIFARHGY